MCQFLHYLAAAVLKAFRFASFCVSSVSSVTNLIPYCKRNTLYKLYVLNVLYSTSHRKSCPPQNSRLPQGHNVQHLHAQSSPATGYNIWNLIQIQLLMWTFENLHLNDAMNKPDTRIVLFHIWLNNCRLALIQEKEVMISIIVIVIAADFLDTPHKETKVKSNYTFTIMNHGCQAWQPVFAAWNVLSPRNVLAMLE